MNRKIWCEVTEEGQLNMGFRYKGKDYALGVSKDHITPDNVIRLYQSVLASVDIAKEKK